MKGYKGMPNNMICRGVQYEVGKTYRVCGNIEVCRNGLHFCQDLRSVFEYYPNDKENSFFEVEAIGTTKTVGNKSATSELTIVRRLTDIEVNRCYYGDGYGDGDVKNINKIAIFKD